MSIITCRIRSWQKLAKENNSNYFIDTRLRHALMRKFAGKASVLSIANQMGKAIIDVISSPLCSCCFAAEMLRLITFFAVTLIVLISFIFGGHSVLIISPKLLFG